MTLRVQGAQIRRGGRTLSFPDLNVAPGERLALVGPNGVGKSTLLASVAGVLAPRAGVFEINGVSVWGTRARQARQQLGYAPEAADPPAHLTGAELWALVQAVRGGELGDSISAALELQTLAKIRIGEMSLGMRRRACLGAALLGAPPLLVLDEPDNGLDSLTLTRLAQVLANYSGAVLLASHDPAFTAAVGARSLLLAATPS